MKNRNKIVYYERGDNLAFTLQGSRVKIQDEIISFMSDSLIRFKHRDVNVREIDGVFLDKKNKVWWFLSTSTRSCS